MTNFINAVWKYFSDAKKGVEMFDFGFLIKIKMGFDL